MKWVSSFMMFFVDLPDESKSSPFSYICEERVFAAKHPGGAAKANCKPCLKLA
jgi:hypothetical protein